jgi:hypothetical protein
VNRRSKIDRVSPHSIEILPDRGDASYAVSDGGWVRLHAPDVHAMIPTVTLETEICGARNGIRFFARSSPTRASATGVSNREQDRPQYFTGGNNA